MFLYIVKQFTFHGIALNYNLDILLFFELTDCDQINDIICDSISIFT